MKSDIEKRKYSRYQQQLPIMYSSPTENPYSFYGGQILNQSPGGVFFTSNRDAEPGSLITIEKAKSKLETEYQKKDETMQMRVVWCKGLVDQDHPNVKYGIGSHYAYDSDRVADQLDSDSIAENGKAPAEELDASIESLCTNPSCREIKSALDQTKKNAELRANELVALNRFAVEMTSTLELDKILKIICEEMVKIFGARNAGIGILNSKKTKLKLVAFHTATSDESDATGLEIPIVGNAATIYVIENSKTIVVPDVQHNPIMDSYHDIASSRGTHCIMVVPLIARGEVIGTIGLPTLKPDRVYTASDVTLAQTIASQISSVIENARLYEETERARDAAEHELEIGREIQSGFLPDHIPDVDGWEFTVHFKAARYVAGDFYDIFTLGESKLLGIAVGDICDKGVGAALFMALFRTLIRAFTLQKVQAGVLDGKSSLPHPDEIINNTIFMTNNYIATSHGEDGMFATLFFGILNTNTGDLFYINCGHQAPVIICDNSIKAQLDPTGPALGMFPDIDFKTDQIKFTPADMLFACTDGITDAVNKSGEFFGNERLLSLLTSSSDTAKDLMDNIKTSVNNHISSTEQFDDITLLLIRCLNNANP